MGLGDQIAQNFIEKRSVKDLDFVRTAKFFSIGFVIAVSKNCIHIINEILYITWLYNLQFY